MANPLTKGDTQTNEKKGRVREDNQRMIDSGCPSEVKEHPQGRVGQGVERDTESVNVMGVVQKAIRVSL